MADVNLGRASLSVTADLSGFTSALDNAAKQTDKLSTANNIVVTSANNVTTSLDHQTKSIQQLQDSAVSNSILIKNMNLKAQATKLATDNLVLLDGATLIYLKDEKELEFQQAKLNTGFKELETNLLKNDAAFRNNSLLIELNTQKQKNLALENKASMAAMLALDDQAIGYAANQKTLSTELDIATRKLDLQARQMNIDTGATKALHDELVKLEQQEKAVAEQENKVKGINQPVVKIDTNTAEFVKGQMNLKSETDMATKALELQARQMNIDSGATKKLHDEMVKLEQQEKAVAEQENKVKGINQPVAKIDTNTAEFVKGQMNLKSETDMATKALELQARQMNIDSGATKKLHDEMVRLEQIEQKLIASENRARGIPPPLPIKPAPIPEDKNTAAFVLNAKKMALETDLLNKKLDQQARQMMIDSGAAAKLAKELSALEKTEKKLADAEQKINAAAGRGNNAKEMVKAAPKAAGGGMKITDMLGIGFFTAAFTKVFDGALSLVNSIVTGVVDLGTKIIESGSKFQELDRRLTTLTGFKGIAAGLQDIMKTGPSAGFSALGEAATRLAALKFNPQALQPLIKNFNSLGVALGNPEKILNLITDKIADMASEGSATMAALGKLAEEGIPVFESLAQSMGVSVEEAKRRVKEGLVTVSEATQAISDAANMPNMIAAAQASANSFSGIFSRVTNNIEVLFQNIGVKILDGFGLVFMGDTITSFFDSIFVRVDELTPIFTKIGAFAALVTEEIMFQLTSFTNSLGSFADNTSTEDMLSSMKTMATDIVSILQDLVNVLIDAGIAGKKAAEDISWWAGIGSNTASGIQNYILNPISNGIASTAIWVGETTGLINNIETIGNNAIAAADNVNALSDALNKPKDDFSFSGTGGSFMTDLEEAIKASGDSIAAELDKINNLPLMQEAPKWQKFLDENLTPLQQYQREIEKLNMLMDGSEQGFQAFAIGSSNALQKLKQSTGMGGEPKFASAITKGSAEDFKATLDAQNKNKDVNQEIKELMQVAAEIQQQQLDAQIAIAQAIKAQAPAQVLAFCGPV